MRFVRLFLVFSLLSSLLGVSGIAEAYSGYIVSVTPTTFAAGQRSPVYVTVKNTGATVDLAVEPKGWTSGWNFDDNESEFPDNNYQRKSVAAGATATFTFYVTPPAQGGICTVTWDLHAVYWDIWHDVWVLLDREPVTISSAYPLGGYFVSFSPSTFLAGSTSDVTVTVKSTGSASGSYAVEPKNWTSGWNFSDNEAEFPDNNYQIKTISAGGTATYTFKVTPPTLGGSVTVQWDLSGVINGSWKPLDSDLQNVFSLDPYTGQILSVSPSSFQAGVRTPVTVTVRHTGTKTVDFAVEPKGWTSGWNFDDNESEFPDNNYQRKSVAAGATTTYTFYVTAPALGGSGSVTWYLHAVYGVPDTWRQNHTLGQTVTSANPYSGSITSVSPSTFLAGSASDVTVTVQNTGRTASLAVEPKNWTSGWNFSDNDADLDNYLRKTVNSGSTATYTFKVTPPVLGGTGSVTWYLHVVYDDGGEKWYPLHTFPQSVSSQDPYTGRIVSVSPSTFQAGVRTPVTVTVQHTGTKTVDFAVEPKNWTSGWNFDDNETFEFPDNNYQRKSVAAGATTTYTFYVTAPALGGSGSVTWYLHAVYGVPDTWRQNHTLGQSVTSANPYSGSITSVSPSTFPAGEWRDVNVVVQNSGRTASLAVEPKNWTSGWNFSDNEVDLDNYQRKTVTGGSSTTYTFRAKPPVLGGTGTVVWYLHVVYDDGGEKWYPLHTFSQSLDSTLTIDIFVRSRCDTAAYNIPGANVYLNGTLKGSTADGQDPLAYPPTGVAMLRVSGLKYNDTLRGDYGGFSASTTITPSNVTLGGLLGDKVQIWTDLAVGLDVPYYNQHGTQWCAFTSLAMQLNYHLARGNNPPAPKPWQVAKRFGKGPDDGAWMSDISNWISTSFGSYAWDAFGLSSTNTSFFFADREGLKRYIAENVGRYGRPILFATSGIGSAGHAVLIVGCTSQGVRINDPSGYLLGECGLPSDPSNCVSAFVEWSKLNAYLDTKLALFPANAMVVTSPLVPTSSRRSATVLLDPTASDLSFKNPTGTGALHLYFDGRKPAGYYYSASLPRWPLDPSLNLERRARQDDIIGLGTEISVPKSWVGRRMYLTVTIDGLSTPVLNQAVLDMGSAVVSTYDWLAGLNRKLESLGVGPGRYTLRLKLSDGAVVQDEEAIEFAVGSRPLAVNDTYSVYSDETYGENTPGVLQNDSDPEGSALSAVLVSGPSHGTLTLNSNGSFQYTPATGYTGPDSFVYLARGFCDSKPATVTLNVTNPVPVLNSIDPTEVFAGGPGFTLKALGSRFVTSSKFYWNTTECATTRLDSTRLSTSIPADWIKSAGTVLIKVFTPTPGGGTTVSKTLTIKNPVPSISSVSPPFAEAGGGAFTLTVNGSGFVTGSMVKWNGSERSTTYVSATELRAAIPASDIEQPGSATVTVFNGSPGGGESNPIGFEIRAVVPTINTLSPSSASAGGNGFTLTVTGSGFIASSKVRWNGEVRNTTVVSASKLEANIASNDIAQVGTAQVTVVNLYSTDPKESNPLPFEIVNPTPELSWISPTSAKAGSGDLTLVVSGFSFLNTSEVRWNGVGRPTIYVDKNQLKATIFASDLANPGTAEVTVLNPAPGGGTSAPKTFTIDPQDQWVQWNGNGHWYKAVSVPAGITWFEAKAAAEAEGGYLATLSSVEENEFVFGLVTNPSFWSSRFGPWFGLHQPNGSAEPSGGWAWVTGEPLAYVNWAPGEPSNSHGNQDCGIFFNSSASEPASTWDDFFHGPYAGIPIKGYIIEKPSTAPTPVADSFVAWRDQALLVSPRGVMDNDPDSYGWSSIEVTPPSHGSLSLAPDGGFVYTPAEGWYGSDGFTYRLEGYGLRSSQVEVSIIVRMPKAFIGKVELSDFVGDYTKHKVDIEFRKPGSTGVYWMVSNVELMADGAFAFQVADEEIPDGQYAIYCKGSHWLKQRLGELVLVPSPAMTNLRFSLLNGDVDGDNTVTVFDYALLSHAFDTVEGDPNWNPDADLDGDGAVTVFDYAILSDNFDMVGDE